MNKDKKMLTIKEIKEMTIPEAIRRGMVSWDGELYLIPLRDWQNWPQGAEVTSINGDVKVKGSDNIDEDTRYGLLAWGIYPKPGEESVDHDWDD